MNDRRRLWMQIERSPVARRRLGMFLVVTILHELGKAALDDTLRRELPLRLSVRDDAIHLTLAHRSLARFPISSLFT